MTTITNSKEKKQISTVLEKLSEFAKVSEIETGRFYSLQDKLVINIYYSLEYLENGIINGYYELVSKEKFEEYFKEYHDNFFILFIMENYNRTFVIPVSLIQDKLSKKPYYSKDLKATIIKINDDYFLKWKGSELTTITDYFNNMEILKNQLKEENMEIVPTERKIEQSVSKVNFRDFLDSIDFEKLNKSNPITVGDPDTIKIHQIMDKCENGKWVLPNFQRYFVWNKNQIRELLQSIANDYYIGSLLLWECENEIPLDIVPIEGVNMTNKSIKPTMIILDGQQRITSLYHAIRAPDIVAQSEKTPSYFYLNFQKFFEKNEDGHIVEILTRKLDKEETYEKLLFPFYDLEVGYNWAFELQKFLENKYHLNMDKLAKIRQNVDNKLHHIFYGFKIPYISLPKSMDLDQITEIFEKINTTGIKLNAFDLLIARLNKYDIELKDLWAESVKTHPKLEQYHKAIKKIQMYILQSISLYYHKTSACSRKEILNIHHNIFNDNNMKFDKVWLDMSSYINKALEKLENLRDGFGVVNTKILPSSTTIPMLAALLKVADDSSNKVDTLNKISIWYWSSVFSNAYSGTVDSKMTFDFREMRNWFTDDSKIPKTILKIRRDIDNLDLFHMTNKGNAVYKGTMCLYAIKGSKDFETGQFVEHAENNEFDHIFPKSKFSDSFVNSVLNMSWLPKFTNSKKGTIKPSEYVSQLLEKNKNDEKQFLKTLESHYINIQCYEHLKNDNLVRFIQERRNMIVQDIKKLIGQDEKKIPQNILITPNRPYANRRAIENIISQCEDHIYWMDKYFSKEGLDILEDSLIKDKIYSIKILSTLTNMNIKLRKSFQRFREDRKVDGIKCEFRVIKNKDNKNIHDRWILSKNKNFNIPSPDVIARGQLSEINETTNSIPFDELWENSIDIIDNWNEIEKILNNKLI